jgi:hypothetical protein
MLNVRDNTCESMKLNNVERHANIETCFYLLPINTTHYKDLFIERVIVIIIHDIKCIIYCRIQSFCRHTLLLLMLDWFDIKCSLFLKYKLTWITFKIQNNLFSCISKIYKIRFILYKKTKTKKKQKKTKQKQTKTKKHTKTKINKKKEV